MKRPIIIIDILLIILLFVTPVFMSCVKTTSIAIMIDLNVLITDQAGNPLSGAKVVSEEEPQGQLKVTGLTDQNGRVFFKSIKAGDYSFYVSRFDYTQVDFEITLNTSKDFSVKMAPIST